MSQRKVFHLLCDICLETAIDVSSEELEAYQSAGYLEDRSIIIDIDHGSISQAHWVRIMERDICPLCNAIRKKMLRVGIVRDRLVRSEAGE